MRNNVKAGDSVMVKHECSINSPISAHRTHEVVEVYSDNTLLLKGYHERLPAKMFEKMVIRKTKHGEHIRWYPLK